MEMSVTCVSSFYEDMQQPHKHFNQTSWLLLIFNWKIMLNLVLVILLHKYQLITKACWRDLTRDKKLGVFELVPFGESVIWCYRDIVKKKQQRKMEKDGSSRTIIDISPLNKYWERNVLQKLRVSTQKSKTVTDAWDGYHGISLWESRHSVC